MAHDHAGRARKLSKTAPDYMASWVWKEAAN
jgi:hypothetical protein